LKQATIETFDFDEIEVIPNFICSTHYQKLPDLPLKKEIAPNGERILVHLSNFRAVKRPVDCVEIFAKVLEKGGDAKLVFVGDGPEYSAVHHRARTLNVLDKTVFVGKQPNIADYLGIADVSLLPSETESFGLAVLEAQACEVPVVASRVGGIPEVVSDGESGFLSEVGNTDKMSDDVLKILNDDELHESFGKKGRELAVSRYSAEKIIPQYIKFYEKILKGKSEPSAVAGS
jgi:N-acetyl-alpha-D-glucosaminyl L-malate synthase BshA